jgi:hypothetical protein
VQTTFAKHLERREAVSSVRSAITRHLQDFADGFAEIEIVLDHENPRYGVIGRIARIVAP